MIRISAGLTDCVVDDERVVLDETSGRYFGLNPVASRIFALVREGKDMDGMLPILRSEFEAPEEELRRDVRAFIAQLVAWKLAADEAPEAAPEARG